MDVLKGAPVAKGITEECREIIETAGVRPPLLVIVRVGEEPGDLSYEAGAIKRMQKAGVETRVVTFPADVKSEEFIERFSGINSDPEVDGILVFRPLPKQIDSEQVSMLIDPDKDMDGFSPENMEKLFAGKGGVRPCTPQAVMEILDKNGIELRGKRVVVLGRSMVVGRPLSMMLLEKDATVTICHSRTVDLPAVCREADVLIAAVGRAEMVDASYVKPGAVVIDVGINDNGNGGITGDVNFESVSEKAGAVTPVPGGVGAVTTSVLLKNVVSAWEKKVKK